eukprot:tig00021098_g18185.t1
MPPLISLDEIYDEIANQCRDAAAVGQRGHCMFDPALLAADGAAAIFAINPPRPASSQFSARVFVNTDPAKPASYAPADVFYVPPGSPLCDKEVFRERVEPGFYIEAQPGRRFAVVAEEHFGPLKAIATETNKFTVFIPSLRRYTTILVAGKRCTILGDLADSAALEAIINPFVFEALDSEIMSSGSACAAGSASSSSSASSAKPGSFQVEFAKAVLDTSPNEVGSQQLGKRAEDQEKQAGLLRKRAKILGGLASVDTNTSLGNKISRPLTLAPYIPGPGGCLFTLTVRYRSRLWMMVAGLRPDLLPGPDAEEAPAAAGAGSEFEGARGSSSSEKSVGSSSSGGGGGGSSASSSASAGSSSGAGSSRGKSAAAAVAIKREGGQRARVPAPQPSPAPIDLDSLPDTIDLSADDE